MQAKQVLHYIKQNVWKLGQHGQNHPWLRRAHQTGIALTATGSAIHHYEIPISNIDPATILAFCLAVLPVSGVANLCVFFNAVEKAKDYFASLSDQTIVNGTKSANGKTGIAKLCDTRLTNGTKRLLTEEGRLDKITSILGGHFAFCEFERVALGYKDVEKLDRDFADRILTELKEAQAVFVESWERVIDKSLEKDEREEAAANIVVRVVPQIMTDGTESVLMEIIEGTEQKMAFKSMANIFKLLEISSDVVSQVTGQEITFDPETGKMEINTK